jgi:pimeloyl-ACP methyl ester carboxylesterase
VGTWGFARALVREEDHLQQLHERIEILRRLPVLVIWGMADPMVGAPHLERWKEALPEARFEELSDDGHFPQEEAGQQVADLVQRFVAAG